MDPQIIISKRTGNTVKQTVATEAGNEFCDEYTITGYITNDEEFILKHENCGGNTYIDFYETIDDMIKTIPDTDMSELDVDTLSVINQIIDKYED